MMKNLVQMFFVLVLCTCRAGWAVEYPWLSEHNADQCLGAGITPPPGFSRVECRAGEFGHWLRHLPLKPGHPPVLLYDGREKINQAAHQAVIDMDVGEKDLQQCADAVIRLRAEYLYFRERYDDIHFNFTSGHRADYSRWARGFRPVIAGNRVRWSKTAEPETSYLGFRDYLETVFMYAGSYSLERELIRVEHINEMRIGDVFIQGGFPGHAVIVLDIAEDNSGRKVFLLGQSYMPAQQLHVLKNPLDEGLSPWYRLDFADKLVTPEWTFRKKDLRRFE